MFLHDLGLSENPFLLGVPQMRRNWQLTLCLIHLAAGNNLWCQALKGATLENCVRDVALFLQIGLPVSSTKN